MDWTRDLVELKRQNKEKAYSLKQEHQFAVTKRDLVTKLFERLTNKNASSKDLSSVKSYLIMLGLLECHTDILEKIERNICDQSTKSFTGGNRFPVSAHRGRKRP